MVTVSETKKKYYQNQIVVENYDQIRFSSPGGAYVNDQELAIILNQLKKLKKNLTILDVPVGTGRLAEKIEEMNFSKIYGIDTSAEMLIKAKNKTKDTILIQSDVRNLPCENASIDVVICLRFLFHFKNIENILMEFSRVLKPGGIIIFDTISWTPRTYMFKLNHSYGGRIYVHSSKKITQLLNKHHFDEVSRKRIFTLPSYLYTFLPLVLLKIMIRLDRCKWIPKSKVIWKFCKKN